MEVTKTNRGFEWIDADFYPPEPGKVTRLVAASSAIGKYEDSFDRPGSSYLWVGQHIHLDREQVRELVSHLQAWLDTGSLKVVQS